MNKADATHVFLENNGLQVDLHSLDNLVSTLTCHILSLLFVIIDYEFRG